MRLSVLFRAYRRARAVREALGEELSRRQNGKKHKRWVRLGRQTDRFADELDRRLKEIDDAQKNTAQED